MKKLLTVLVPVLILGVAFVLYRDFAASPADKTAANGAAGHPATTATAPGAAGRDTISFWNPATGAGRRWVFAAGVAPAVQDGQGANVDWTPLAVARHGWGGRDLMAWLQSGTREIRLWQLGDDGVPAATAVVPYRGTDWSIVALADADGDGEADLVWQAADGTVAVWTLRDGKPTAQSPVGQVAGRSLVAVADLDGNGKDELVWRDAASGEAEVWTLDGVKSAQARPLTSADSAWRLAGVVRMDADASEDLLWVNDATGQLGVWFAGDPARRVLLQRPVAAGWTLAAIADVDGDGRDELVWTNDADGSAGAWRLAVDGAVSDVALPAAGAGWRPVSDRVVRVVRAASAADAGAAPVAGEGGAG